MDKIQLIIVLLFFCSCNDFNKNNLTNDSTGRTINAISDFDHEPRFEKIDSLQVLFFDDPYGDSLRYNRFFSFVNSNDSSLIFEVKYHLQQPFEIKTSIDTCRSEGKIYLLAGAEPVKTIYFSSRCPAYFIKDGNFYYFDLNESFRRKISLFRKMAKRE